MVWHCYAPRKCAIKSGRRDARVSVRFARPPPRNSGLKQRGTPSLDSRTDRRAAENLVLGVDIGGTKVAAGLVNARGKVLHASRAPMSAHGSAEQGFRSVCDAIDAVMLHAAVKKVEAIGLCSPGSVDSKSGMVLRTANLPCWRNFPLVRRIEKRYRLPTRLINDANAAALAEARWGAGKGRASIFYVSLGTGIGTALVLQGRIHEGLTGGAGEGGHMTINFRGPLCGCGKRGCVELYASGTAIAKRARSLLRRGGNGRSRVLKMAGGRISRITAEIVSKAASEGDRLAKKIMEEAAEFLAIWLGGMIDLLEPEVIIFGGGLGAVMLSMRGHIQKKLDAWAINPQWKKVRIVSARFEAQSALVGAAAQWFSPRER
ncbi:MAG: ROK family protein [Candidatus Acidiferrales bacterium]